MYPLIGRTTTGAVSFRSSRNLSLVKSGVESSQVKEWSQVNYVILHSPHVYLERPLINLQDNGTVMHRLQIKLDLNSGDFIEIFP